MERIMTKPFPNWKILDKAESTIKNNLSTEEQIIKDLAELPNRDDKKYIVLAEYTTGEKRIVLMRPIIGDQKIFTAVFPDPVLLFLSQAVNDFNLSEILRKNHFLQNSKKYKGQNLYLLDAPFNETNQQYTLFVQNRITSIILLAASIEAFLNSQIKDDFIWEKITPSGKIKKYNRGKIESAAVRFEEKIQDILPEVLGQKDFWTNNQSLLNSIKSTYSLRNDFIHLKYYKEKNMGLLPAFINLFDEMLNLNIEQKIKEVIKFMNMVSDNFVELYPQ